MTTRDSTPVQVTLDRRRAYREQDSDRFAVWVGPGQVNVPAWVAQAWGMAPEGAQTAPGAQEGAQQGSLAQAPETSDSGPSGAVYREPFAGYDELNVSEVVQRLEQMDEAEREAVRVYEAATKRRKGVLEALEE